MADEKVCVHATVRVVIELKASAWGGDCALAQVYKQARENAINQLNSAFHDSPHRVKLLETEVTAVIVKESR